MIHFLSVTGPIHKVSKGPVAPSHNVISYSCNNHFNPFIPSAHNAASDQGLHFLH